MVPSLLARDLNETLSFYQRLGFAVTGHYPSADDPVWAEIKRGEICFQFYTEPPHSTPASPICSGTIYLFPDDVRSLANELKGVVAFEWGPEVMDYGMREFAIRDPNGYLIAFTEPA